MTPIISPWFIYLLSVVDAIKGIFVVGAIIGATTVVIILMGMVIEDWEWEGVKKIFKVILPISLTCLFFSIFVPNKKIIIAMYVTKFVTTDNITKAIDAGGNFKDEVKKDIIEIIEAIKGEQPEKK